MHGLCNQTLNNSTSKQKPSACNLPGIKIVQKSSVWWSFRFQTEGVTMRCLVRTITRLMVRRDLSTDRRWNEDYREKIEDNRRRNCSATSSSMNRHTWRQQGVSLRVWCKNPTSKDLSSIKGVPPTAKIKSQPIKSSSVSPEKDVVESRKSKWK